MNVRLKKTFEFSSGIVHDNVFSVNFYTANVVMMTTSLHGDNQNIAYERMKYWINGVMEHAILIAHDDDMIDKWAATGQRILVLPEKPVDQIIGMMLFSKLNAMAGDHLMITDLEISSTLGDDMWYEQSSEEDLGPFDAPGWWNDPGPSWASKDRKKTLGSKIIKLNRDQDWKSLELDFEEVENNAEDETRQAVLMNFVRDDNK